MGRELPSATRAQLLELARAAAQIAYCPHSNFHVGAAVLAGGQVFTGCNIENASLGLTICAERTAIFRAVASGERVIDAIVVSCPDARPDWPAQSRMPCGACRQVISEFTSPTSLLIVDGVGEFTQAELLPEAFVLGIGSNSPQQLSNRLRPLPRLCIDIDNVVAETDEVMRKIIGEYTSGRVDLQYSDIVDFDYRNCSDGHGQNLRRGNQNAGTVDEWHAVHEIFSSRVAEVQPYPGIQGILRNLSQGFELHFVTSRLYQARAGTISWLARHGFPEDIWLHFVRSGEKHLAIGNFFAAVEDELNQAVAFAHAGIHSFVRAHPWNASGKTGLVHRYDTWEQIASALKSLAGLRD